MLGGDAHRVLIGTPPSPRRSRQEVESKHSIESAEKTKPRMEHKPSAVLVILFAAALLAMVVPASSAGQVSRARIPAVSSSRLSDLTACIA